MTKLHTIAQLIVRECTIMAKTPIYFFACIFIPFGVAMFFTTMHTDGQPVELPVGVVDQDNSSTSRNLVRQLDGFQTSNVVAHYNNVNEARQAVQRGDIYAFLFIPSGTEQKLVSSRQPSVSLYYNNAIMLAGSTTFKDMKTVANLGSAAVGMKKLAAIGKSNEEIKATLQPISLQVHLLNNPWANYNVYLSTVLVPGIFMMLIFLITVYSLGTELKFGTARELMKMANRSTSTAIFGKMLPQALVHIIVFCAFEFYIFHTLGFPHPGGTLPIVALSILTVIASQCFGIFLFGIIPSLRMAMTLCALWGMLGFSLAGATFPVSAMHPFLQALSWLFPLRHFYMIYQINILGGYPIAYAAPYWASLLAFTLLPIIAMQGLRRAFLVYKYTA